MSLDLHPHVDEGRRRYRKGCRCVVCKAAVAEYQRTRRQHRNGASEGNGTRETTFPTIPAGVSNDN